MKTNNLQAAQELHNVLDATATAHRRLRTKIRAIQAEYGDSDLLARHEIGLLVSEALQDPDTYGKKVTIAALADHSDRARRYLSHCRDLAVFSREEIERFQRSGCGISYLRQLSRIGDRDVRNKVMEHVLAGNFQTSEALGQWINRYLAGEDKSESGNHEPPDGENAVTASDIERLRQRLEAVERTVANIDDTEIVGVIFVAEELLKKVVGECRNINKLRHEAGESLAEIKQELDDLAQRLSTVAKA